MNELFGFPVSDWAKVYGEMQKQYLSANDLFKAMKRGDYEATKLHARIAHLEAKLREIKDICDE